MKTFKFLFVSILVALALSCSKDDNNNPPAQAEQFEATINGDAYSNYEFILGVYQITPGTNGNTLSIDIGDPNGEMITLFLNGTGGFSSGTSKVMGNVDSNNFVTYALLRQSDPQLSYYSSGGTVTISNNRVHPDKSGFRLISGNFDITTSANNGNTASVSGSFSELEYAD